MILVRDLRLAPQEPLSALRERAAKKLRVEPGRIESLKLVKRSLDARKKDDIHYVCAAAVSIRGAEALLLRRAKDAALYTEPVYEIPQVKTSERPVVVGFGPAGMFAALVLARAGARPLVLERGECVERRQQAVEAFRAGGRLDPESNVQFGEGGAGTFSDGKLNTGTHDRRISFVLREFAAHGAPESVVYDAKPHIGTDVLVAVVRSIREEILSLGGESRLILAIGHSARDTVEKLYAQGVAMQPKAFAMGVRIEHKQTEIDLAQYGRARGTLPAADYALHERLPSGSAFTFCMCPGGQVFAAASEEGGVVTNGMSYSARDGENANSALLVGLEPADFPEQDALGGMRWQREIERAAYACGGGDYRAPAQLVGDFLARRPSAGPGTVLPSYRPGVVWGELDGILPEKITATLREAIPALGRKLRGFDAPDAVLTAPETRSSSPVRILRGEGCEAALRGLFPCGEGAGYAGGITSAAVDGLRCAEAVLGQLGEQT